MSEVRFEVGEETVVVSGIFVAHCIDGDSKNILKLISMGEPSSWTQIGLLQAALDRTREQLKASWEG